MKKILLILSIFLFLAWSASAENVLILKVANNTTAFGKIKPAGTIVFDASSDEIYKLTAKCSAVDTLTTASKVPIAGTGVVPVSVENPLGLVYINGLDSSEDSHRFQIDDDTGFAEIVVMKSGLPQPASLLTGPNSLWVGKNVGIAGIGHHLATEARDGHLHFHANSEFDGELSTADTRILNAYSYTEHMPVVPDESGEWTGTIYNYNYPSTDHRMFKNVYYKTGATAATAPVRFRVWDGTSDTGVFVFDQTYPSSQFPANTEIIVSADGYLEFDTGKNYYVRVSSDNTFSLKTTADLLYPYTYGDVSLLYNDNLLQTTEWVDGGTYTAGDYFIDSRKLYICNTTGIQTGTFAGNSDKWDLLSSVANDYWTKTGSALTYNDETRNRVLIDTDGFKVYDNAGVDRFFIGDTFSQLRGETDAVGSRVLVSDIFAALMYGTGHIKILDNAIEINDTNRTRLEIDSSKVRITAATGAGYFQMTDDALLYEDGNKDRLDITPILTTIHDEPDTGGGYLSLESKEFTVVDGTVARIFTDALETTLVSPNNSVVVRVTDSGVKGVMTAAFVGGVEGVFSVARHLTYGGTGTSNMGVTMPLAGKVTYMTLSVRANTSLTCTLRVNDINSSDDISLVAEQTATSTASTTFAAGDRVLLFKEGTTTADELVGTFFVEFDN